MTLRLLHLSDIHFGCENKAAVAAAVTYAGEGRFDAVVVTGDVTQWGATSEFRSARAWMEALPAPRVCTPGNHDTPYWGLMDRLFWPFRRYASHIGPAGPETYASPGLHVTSVNTSRGAQVRLNWSKGQVRARDVEIACRRLAMTPGALRVAAFHHPLMEVTGGPMTGRVWGGRRASELLAQNGVDLILTGHVHMPFAHALPFGDRMTYAVGASTLSTRERGVPPGFNVIEAEDDGIAVTAMAWTGSCFEAQRSWGFDRRKPSN